MFTYDKRKGWTGLMGTALYAITDKRTGSVTVRPGDGMAGIGPEVTIRVATRDEAERLWQSPLSAGWIVADNVHHECSICRSRHGLEIIHACE